MYAGFIGYRLGICLNTTHSNCDCPRAGTKAGTKPEPYHGGQEVDFCISGPYNSIVCKSGWENGSCTSAIRTQVMHKIVRPQQ